MINHFCKKPLWEVSRVLTDVAMGRRPADTVVTDAVLVNVCTKELLPHVDVAVAEGRIAMVGDCRHCIGEGTVVVDAEGRWLSPAFMDGHIHIESSMLTAGEYAKAVVPHGTSAVFMDPHEICNVAGFEGVRCMLFDAARTPLKSILSTPSCVPAVPGFEDTGASVGPEDVRESMTWDECSGLGEMMNFPGVIYGDPRTHAIVGETLKADKIVTGHFSIPDTGAALNAYVAAGVRCCHESARWEDALAKMRLGMYAMFREGSAWHDLQEVAKAVTQHEVDSRFACLVSDDTHPHTLLGKGHMDHIVRRAVEEGIPPVEAIQMATINVATCFQLDHEMGSIAPGKCADMVLLSDLATCKVAKVWIDGDLVAEDGRLTAPIGDYTYPDNITHSVHLSPVSPAEFRIPHAGPVAKVRVIEAIPAKTSTIERFDTLPVVDGGIAAAPDKDILKAFVFERHHGTGTRGFGFLKGFGIRHGALAQTVAHDAHNLLVVGDNDEDMALAVSRLIDMNGGLVAVADGKVLAAVALPIAGLMSDKPLAETNEAVKALEDAWRTMGCTLPSPFMTMSIIPLACLPEVRLTNRGMVDCRTFTFVDPIVE
ncbi:MAG: adenine deaminase [Clostridia bacterium]|nr:adenine deaminase [Clostridia bacterium]